MLKRVDIAAPVAVNLIGVIIGSREHCSIKYR